MARYNVRDLIGHWVKPRSRAGKMCPHKCCRGYRVHPDNFPVILPRELLRTARERDLIAHYEQHGTRDCPECEKVRTQILGEIDLDDLNSLSGVGVPDLGISKTGQKKSK